MFTTQNGCMPQRSGGAKSLLAICPFLLQNAKEGFSPISLRGDIVALYTKKLIMTTFQEMLAEMPFDRITVSALVKRAGAAPIRFTITIRTSMPCWTTGFKNRWTPLFRWESPSSGSQLRRTFCANAGPTPKPSIMCLILFPGTGWVRCLKTSCTAPFRTPNKRNLPQGLPRKGQLFCAKKENCANLRIEPTVLKFGGSGLFRHGIRVQIPLNL